MKTRLKEIISIFVIIIALVLIYTSAYLPYVKASLYIKALKEQTKATSVEEFITPMEKAFNFWSPVGQPEEIRFFASNIASMLFSQKESTSSIPQEVAFALVDYTVKLLNSNPPGMKGLNYSQSLLLEASLLFTYGQRFNDFESLKKAEDLYKKGLELSPKRPQFLYGLLSIYLYENRKDDLKNVAQEILKYWPQDERVKQILENLETFSG